MSSADAEPSGDGEPAGEGCDHGDEHAAHGGAADEEPAEQADVAVRAGEGLLAHVAVAPGRLVLGVDALDDPVAGDEVGRPPHRVREQGLVHPAVPGQPPAEQAHDPHREWCTGQHDEAERPRDEQQRDGDEHDPGQLRDRVDRQPEGGGTGDVVRHEGDHAAVRLPGAGAVHVQHRPGQGDPQPVLDLLGRLLGELGGEPVGEGQHEEDRGERREPQRELCDVAGRQRPVDGEAHDDGHERLAHLPQDAQGCRGHGEAPGREDHAEQEAPRRGLVRHRERLRDRWGRRRLPQHRQPSGEGSPAEAGRVGARSWRSRHGVGSSRRGDVAGARDWHVRNDILAKVRISLAADASGLGLGSPPVRSGLLGSQVQGGGGN